MLLTLICIFADFLLLPPTLLLVEGLGGWPASPPQFPLQRVREAPWGPPRCGLPCEGFPRVGLLGGGRPAGAFSFGGWSLQDPHGRGLTYAGRDAERVALSGLRSGALSSRGPPLE
jgi:hypothetical protein